MAGFKDFAPLTALPASDLDQYLMAQVMMQFANTSARDTALPTPDEGMHVYLTGSDVIQVYDGSDWVTIVRLEAMRVTVSRTTTQSIDTGASYETVAWNSEVVDPYGFHSGSDAELTVPAGVLPGTYLAFADVHMEAIAAGDYARARIEVNGTAVYAGSAPSCGTGIAASISVAGMVNLSAGDDVTVAVRHTRGSGWNLLGTDDGTPGSRFGLVWIGANP